VSAIDSDTLQMLRDGFARFAQESYAFETRARRVDAARGYDRAAWDEYGKLGWLAIGVPGDLGGFDGDPAAIGALMEYVGGALAMEPVLASAVMSARVLSRCRNEAVDAWLSQIAAGEQVFALAHADDAEPTTVRDGRVSGRKIVVLHGDVADRLLVTARDDSGKFVLCVVDARAAGVTMSLYPLVDGRGAASFDFAQAGGIELKGDGFEDALDEARVALCAEAYGAMRAANAATLDYLRTRQQFGRPIGANQVLQHRMVDLFILQEETRAVLDTAERALAGPSRERVRAVSAAAAHTAAASRHTAHEAVQMHGGMGITEELPVSHYFRRLMVTARLLGDREMHVARFASTREAA
jgi:alkylation response protein AidB-like acyl-CoA dehydrogenase